MSTRKQTLFRSFLALGLFLTCCLSSALAQEAQSDAEKELRRVVGSWTLNPLAADAPVPEPPPIYASYRKKDEAAPPALETIPRLLLELKEGKLVGKAVLPAEFPLTDENRDVTGKAPVDISEISFDGTDLKFKVPAGDQSFEATAQFEGRVLKGSWKLSGSDKSGALYMHRRYR